MQTNQISLARGGAVRRLWPSESTIFEAHLLRLDQTGRRLRFSGAVSDVFIQHYAAKCLDDAEIVFGWFVDGTLRGTVELHRIGGYTNRTGEAAFSVEPGFRDRGIGSTLMGRAVLAARNLGMRRMIVCCLRENTRMQHIAQKYQAEITFEDGDVLGTLRTSHPSPFSLVRAAISESHGLAHTLLDRQSDLIRRAS
jgi:GNAT superfamily N-acetyltransferase